MSKRNMLLGLAAGKIGDLVFYRDGGEQRTRTRVVPKNPRSQAQMAQRVRIANVSATYRLLKSILAYSFTGRPSNQSGYNAFASGAIEISPFLTREIALADACVPAPYVIARGTIAPLPYELASTEGDVYLEIFADGISKESVTIAKVSQILLSSYPQLQQGDVLNFVSVEYQLAEDDNESAGYNASSSIVSFKIDTTDEGVLPSTRFSVNGAYLHFSVMGEAGAAAGAVVVSRVDGNGALQTSFAKLLLSAPAETAYESFRTDNALLAATDSYGVGADSILRD